MGIVMDTSAILAALMHQPGEKDWRGEIRRLTNGVELFAPSSVRWELGNAVRNMVVQKRLSLVSGLALLKGALDAQVNYINVDPLNAWYIAIQTRSAAYDAYVLECARATGHPLLTIERYDRMPAKARALRIQLVEVDHG
ncbi:MAG: type II toxin-antitoxin system VapC family toxin [Pseudomonadota bacterium]